MLGIVRVKMLKGEKGDTGASGDYATLTNKPSIGGVELNGNKTASDLGLGSLSEQQNLLETVTALNESVNDIEDELAVYAADINALDGSVANLQRDVSALAAKEPLVVTMSYSPNTRIFSDPSDDEQAIYAAVQAHRNVIISILESGTSAYQLCQLNASMPQAAWFTMLDTASRRLYDVKIESGVVSIDTEFVLTPVTP